MSTRRRFLVTAFLVFLLTIGFVGAAFAVSGPPGNTVGQSCPGIGFPAIKDLLNAQKVSQGNMQNFCSFITRIGQAPAAADAKSGGPVLGADTGTLSAEEQQMFDLVNQERVANGVGALASDSALAKLARLKAQDMVDNHYFDHNSPTYGSPFDMMKKFGITYSYAGENLAMAPSVASAHQALMASPGHRANILNKNYDRVGIGIVVSGGYRYCVQMFTGGQSGTIPSGCCSGQQQSAQPSQPTQLPVNNPDLSADEQTLVNLINQERVNAGLPKLNPDSKLFQLARLKARDFIDNNYFGHTSPTYGTLKNMLNSFGVKYVRGGESLAASYTAARAHTALMNSSANRANILNPNFSLVGIGVADNGRYKYFVEIFTDGGGANQSSSGSATQSPVNPSSQTPSGGTAQTPVNPSAQSPVNPSTQPATGNTVGLSADEQRMLDLVNAERAKNGVAPLAVNMNLTRMARIKGQDMIDKNYFDHTSPTYGSPFDMMHQFGINFMTAGENLAGAPSVDIAHTNLMNSPGHRANILNSSFKEVGIGIVDGGPYGKMFVQEFIG